jgi:hypothetical protein
MRKLYLLVAATAFAAMAVPASASTVVYDGTTYNSGNPIVINFVGVQYPNSTGTLTLTFNGTSGNDYDFTYSLLNTSTDPHTNISGFGFDVSGGTLDLGTTTSTGTYGNVSSGSISGGAKVDFCVTGGSNCAGGSNSGPTPGGTATGTLALEFTSLPSSITLEQPIIRMQNTGPNGNGSDIGTPGGTPPVPEPATWAMMVLGFGAAGFAMRRNRRKATLISQLG